MIDPRPAAAFFDLDRTLISGSSAFSFGVTAWRQKLMPTRDLLKDASAALLFRWFGSTDDRSEAVRERILSAVAGVELSALEEVGHEMIPRLVSRVRPESKALVKMHQEAGRDTYIVSASPQEIVDRLAGALGMTGGIGTQGEIVDECLQLFGGYGYMLEYPIARLYADARVQRLYGGTSEIQKEIIARSLDVD